MDKWQRYKREKALLARDGHNCMICGAPFTHSNPSTIDHIVPKSKGGGNELANLRLAHQVCNNRRGNSGGTNWTRSHGGRSIEEVGLG